MEQYKYLDKEIQSEKHLSTLNVPVEMPVSELELQLNNSIKGLIYEDNSYEDDQDNLKARVWKLDRIRIAAKDSTFLFEVPLKIWVSAGYKISPLGITMSGYKDTEFSIRLRLISKIGISPSWQVHSDTYVDSYDWITEPNVKVGTFKIPIKAMVSRLLNRNFEKISSAIDEQINGTIDLKKYAEVAWNLARQPVLLSKEYDTWLVVQPSSVTMTPLLVNGNILRATIGVQAFTQTVTSVEKPTVPKASGLPKLQILDKVPGNFKIGLISLISYEEASRLASKNFSGKSYSFVKGQYTVQVTGIEMYGQNERLVIKVNLTGSMNGYIYLKGVPYYDPVTQMLSLKDLDYDLDTKNSIIRTANWLLQGKFSKMMENALVFPVGEQISSTRKIIQQLIKSYKVTDGIQLKGELSEIAPDRVYLTPKHLYSVVFAQGNVSLKVHGLKGF
ncbi:DUF4403 family protein [Dyadobacter sp. 32]|uniref:DUF4403 family protein n=1 Tax=Dyadobacter sp. 32 TaxID=538966 RepID=UPI0011EBE7BF